MEQEPIRLQWKHVRSLELPATMPPFHLFTSIMIAGDQALENRLWDWIMRRGRRCFDLGIILRAKEREEHPTGCALRLSQLIPDGVIGTICPEHDRQLLILGGVCPEPGGGLVVPLPDDTGVAGFLTRLDAVVGQVPSTEYRHLVREARRALPVTDPVALRRHLQTLYGLTDDELPDADELKAALSAIRPALGAPEGRLADRAMLELLVANGRMEWKIQKGLQVLGGDADRVRAYSTVWMTADWPRHVARLRSIADQMSQRINSADPEGCRDLLMRALPLQEALSRELLLRLEREFGGRLVLWDPARAVGWRIFHSGANTLDVDVAEQARQILHDFGLPGALECDRGDALVTGPAIADYVHDVSGRLGHSVRQITKELLSRLSIQARRGVAANGADLDVSEPAEQAERALASLGWHEPPAEVKSLTDVLYSADGILTIRHGIDLLDVRIRVEDFLRDALRICKTLRNDLPRVATTVEAQVECPARATVDDLRGRIRSVLPHVFDEGTRDDRERFLQTIADLAAVAIRNGECHDNAAFPPNEMEAGRRNLARLIADLIELANRIFGEMPWHFHVRARHGTQPAVLTGQAWSHSHAGSREFRLLVCEGEQSPGSDLLVWNPARGNPIVTSGRILAQ